MKDYTFLSSESLRFLTKGLSISSERYHIDKKVTNKIKGGTDRHIYKFKTVSAIILSESCMIRRCRFRKSIHSIQKTFRQTHKNTKFQRTMLIEVQQDLFHCPCFFLSLFLSLLANTYLSVPQERPERTLANN